MPDIPHLESYAARGLWDERGAYLQLSATVQVDGQQMFAVLLDALKGVELDDVTLLGKWSGARVQFWEKEVVYKDTGKKFIPPCAQRSHNDHRPCDNPAPPTNLITKRTLKTERPFSAKFARGVTRYTTIDAQARGTTLRRGAVVTVDEAAFLQDVFGNLQRLNDDSSEITLTEGARDAVTGERLPE